MTHKSSSQFLPSHLVRLREPAIELGRHEAGLAHEVPILDDTMPTDHAAMHDRSKTSIPVIDLTLFEEPRLDRGEVLVPGTDEPFLLSHLHHLSLDLLPHDDAITVLRSLPELHELQYLRGGRGACLHPARREVASHFVAIIICREPLWELA